MKLLPFDLEKAKAGAKVVNGRNEPVRLVCFDADNEIYPLIDSRYKAYTLEGIYDLGCPKSHSNLFLLAEPTYREWQSIEEVPLNLILRGKSNGIIYYPLSLLKNACHVTIHDGQEVPLDFSDLFKYYEHTTDNGVTWKPCGKELQ